MNYFKKLEKSEEERLRYIKIYCSSKLSSIIVKNFIIDEKILQFDENVNFLFKKNPRAAALKVPINEDI